MTSLSLRFLVNFVGTMNYEVGVIMADQKIYVSIRKVFPYQVCFGMILMDMVPQENKQ